MIQGLKFSIINIINLLKDFIKLNFRIENGILLDEAPFMLNNAKRKLRLVLSTTDLHTADFRHTSVSPFFIFGYSANKKVFLFLFSVTKHHHY